MPEAAVVKRQRRVSSIWMIPGLALVIGGWMLLNALLRGDVTITIAFERADGIEAGRTKVRARNVQVGLVEDVRLSREFDGVVVTARIDRAAAYLLRDDSSFWVVRPKIGAGGISGVGTLLTGAFIELDPGSGQAGSRSYIGLDEIPATPASAKGLRIRVASEQVGSVGVGDPVLFRGRNVGRVDESRFDAPRGQFEYGLFIEPPFDALVDSSTRFWKASAIQFQASAGGFSLGSDSLESLISGGIAFDKPDIFEAGHAIQDGEMFALYGSRADVNKYPYIYYAEYLLLFDNSVRGLLPDAPVVYRGVRVGHVVDVSFRYLGEEYPAGDRVVPVPALVRLYPGYMEWEDNREAVAKMKESIARHAEAHGLAATLHPGNLLTGSLFVSLDFHADESVKGLSTFGEYTVIPTRGGGLQEIQKQILAVLEMIKRMPIEELADNLNGTVGDAKSALRSMTSTLDELSSLLESDAMARLPERLDAALASLENTLNGVGPESALQADLRESAAGLGATLADLRRLLQRLERQPNDLIFSPPAAADPEPKPANR